MAPVELYRVLVTCDDTQGDSRGPFFSSPIDHRGDQCITRTFSPRKRGNPHRYQLDRSVLVRRGRAHHTRRYCSEVGDHIERDRRKPGAPPRFTLALPICELGAERARRFGERVQSKSTPKQPIVAAERAETDAVSRPLQPNCTGNDVGPRKTTFAV